jgi:hypothetical protein
MVPMIFILPASPDLATLLPETMVRQSGGPAPF